MFHTPTLKHIMYTCWTQEYSLAILKLFYNLKLRVDLTFVFLALIVMQKDFTVMLQVKQELLVMRHTHRFSFD